MTQIDPAQLVKARQARALSQEEAAIAADLSSRTIQRIEAGHPASLESTKALLTIFGANIICEPQLAIAVPPPAPWRAAAAQIRGTGHAAAGWGFDGLRLMFAAVFVIVGFSKLIVPANAGLFVEGNRFMLGLVNPPALSHEVLGLWLLPLMLTAASLMLFSIARVRHFVSPYMNRV